MMKHYLLKSPMFTVFLLTIVSACLLVLPQTTSAAHETTNSPYTNLAMNGEFIYNPRSLKWTAINDQGQVVRTGRGSGGRSYCPDIKRSCRTPTGTYHVIAKRGADCRSSRYPLGVGGAAMPYCMFFSKYYAVHGSYDVPNRNASHGCIRVTPSDAAWLHRHFMKIGTTVVVKPY
jgi:hypothetical protein